MMMGFGTEGLDDWTLGDLREMNNFVGESVTMIIDHALVMLGNPDHSCDDTEIGGNPERRLTDAELRTFFAMEDAMKHFIDFARKALEENGQLSTES